MLKDRQTAARLCERGRDSKWFCCRGAAVVSVMAAILRPLGQLSWQVASSHSLSLIRRDAEPIRSQAAEPAATAPPSAAMICMIQDALPIELFGRATSAFADSISAGNAAVAAGGTLPVGAALPAGAASLAAAGFGPAKLNKGALPE